MPTEVTFDLFKYIDANVDVNGDGTEKVIAPGTSGSFAFEVANKSEVNAKYTVRFAEVNDNAVPLQYSVDGSTWKDSIAELTMTELTDQALNMGASDTRTIYWRWAFLGGADAHAGQTNETDTALGILAQTAAPVVTIQATIIVEQID